MKRARANLNAFLLFAAAPLVMVPLTASAAGQVYLVLGCDTSLWNYPSNSPGTVDAYQFGSYYKPDLMTSTNAAGSKVMDAAFRNRFIDSYGQPVKFTWWMMIGSIY